MYKYTCCRSSTAFMPLYRCAFYSYLNASTGFVREALYEWKNTVPTTTIAETANAVRNIQGLMETLYE